MLKTSEVRTLATHPELKSQQSIPFFKTVGEGAQERARAVPVPVRRRAGRRGRQRHLMTVTVFLLLAAYYLLKVARETARAHRSDRGCEGAGRGGAGGAAPRRRAALWVDRSRVNRIRLITIHEPVLRCQSADVLRARPRRRARGVGVLIWLGIFNLFVVSQFWAFANDFYTEGQGRRLFPMIGVGASLGAWVGSTSVPPLIEAAGRDAVHADADGLGAACHRTCR
jgi:AAA family ATP:ADP antiporter